MAIRTLDPVFWDDESIALLSRDARLLFICMVTDPSLTDDFGVLPANARTLRKHAFAFDDDVTAEIVAGWLNEMVTKCPNIVLFEVDSKPWLWLRNFEKFQGLRYHRKTTYPKPPDISEISRNLPELCEKFPMSSVVLSSIEKELHGANVPKVPATPDAGASARVRKKRKPPERSKEEAALMGVFCEATGLHMPHSEKDVNWWFSELRKVAEYAEGDNGRATTLVREVVAEMQGRDPPLTITSPKSIVGMVNARAGGNGMGNGNQQIVPDWVDQQQTDIRSGKVKIKVPDWIGANDG